MIDLMIIVWVGFGVIDYVGCVLCCDGDGNLVQGWGLFEYGVLGCYDLLGFVDWFMLVFQVFQVYFGIGEVICICEFRVFGCWLGNGLKMMVVGIVDWNC